MVPNDCLHRYYKVFIDFQIYQHFVNPSRAHPRCFTNIVAQDGYLTSLALANGNICVCLSLVYVAKCRLLRPHQTSGEKQLKSLECIFHSYEWEQATSLFCMVFGVDRLQAQLTNGAISIATRPTSSKGALSTGLWHVTDHLWCYVQVGSMRWWAS
jgi:hypothetical protein